MELENRKRNALSLVLPLIAVATATLLSSLLHSYLRHSIPYGMFFLAVVVSALQGGFRAGMLANILSLGATYWLHTERIAQSGMSVEEGAAMGLFFIASAVISGLGYIAQKARKTAEESEERLRETVESVGVGIAEVDSNGKYVAANGRACAILKRSRNDLLGTYLVESILPQDRKPVEQNLLKSSGGFPAIDCELRFMDAGGAHVWTHFTARAIEDQTARRRIICTIEDVSQRKQAEAQVQLQAAALEASPSAISISKTDRSGTIVWVNDAFATLTGYPPAEVIGRTHQLLNSGKQERGFYKALWATISRGGVWRGELVNRRKDGTLYYEEMGIQPLRDENGQISHYLAVKQDITARKQAEFALSASEERFRLILQASEIGWWEWDFGGDILVGDLRIKELVGLDANADFSFAILLEQVHPDDRAILTERATALRTKAGDYEVEYRTRQPGGHWRWVLAKGRSFDGPGGKPIRGMGVAMDITTRKRLEEELRAAFLSAQHARGVAERANSTKDHFLAVLSHELRTPLSPVLAAVGLMERRGQVTGEGIGNLEVIRRNVVLEARLIDDLLDVTRIVRGKLALEREPIDVAEVMERAIEICRPDAMEKSIDLNFEAPKGCCIVNADPNRLQQVFWNLLNNAVKFTPIAGRIGFSCHAQDGEVVIKVTDTGMGIDTSTLPRIFDAFEQGENKVTRQFGGLGLGLAISKKLLEMQDGAISAHSGGKNQGAEFKVVLPMVELTCRQTSDTKERQTKITPQRILLVEDHGDTAAMMGAALESLGHEVKTVPDISQALRAAKDFEFDVILSDLGLPDGSGLELMRLLRKTGKHIKGIAISGYGRDEDVSSSRKAGFMEHLTKPVEIDVLSAALERALR